MNKTEDSNLAHLSCGTSSVCEELIARRLLNLFRISRLRQLHIARSSRMKDCEGWQKKYVRRGSCRVLGSLGFLKPMCAPFRACCRDHGSEVIPRTFPMTRVTKFDPYHLESLHILGRSLRPEVEILFRLEMCCVVCVLQPGKWHVRVIR